MECPTGGADHTRSSLLMVQIDAAPTGTAAVASSRPREHPEGPVHHETEHDAEGGLYNDFQVRDPIVYRVCQTVASAPKTAS